MTTKKERATKQFRTLLQDTKDTYGNDVAVGFMTTILVGADPTHDAGLQLQSVARSCNRQGASFKDILAISGDVLDY